MSDHRARTGEFARFLLVGGTGFLIDGGVLSYLLGADWPVIPARLVSFGLAVGWTYLFNRWATFKVRRSSASMERKTALGYLLIQIAGALTNLAVFVLLLEWHPEWRSFPWLPFSVGSAFGLGLNYTLSRVLFQWRKRHDLR